MKSNETKFRTREELLKAYADWRANAPDPKSGQITKEELNERNRTWDLYCDCRDHKPTGYYRTMRLAEFEDQKEFLLTREKRFKKIA